MKYLKKYESFDREFVKEPIEVGDYVIMASALTSLNTFLSTTIGTITSLDTNFAKKQLSPINNIKVQYNNIPINLEDEFNEDGERFFPIMRLKYSSANKEDLEQFILNNKYNI